MGKIIYNKGFTDLILKKTVAPTITFISKTSDSITVTFTNNSGSESTISYGLSSPPNQDTVLLAASATSNNVVISGLDSDTTYTIFASANGTPENLIESEIVSTAPITTDADPFIDTSGSPGATFPINDLDGNPMLDRDKGIAYYGTVSHTDLFTSDELASEVGITSGSSRNNQEVWHKYYWNGGIHFWRQPIRQSISVNTRMNAGAFYGTGTDTSRLGDSFTSVNQDAEVIKNGVTYIIRDMEGSTTPTVNVSGLTILNGDAFGSEFNLIKMNLHAATNPGFYDGGTTYNQSSTTDGVSYLNWSQTGNYTNDDFVGWKTNLGDGDFDTSSNSGASTQTRTSGSYVRRKFTDMSEAVTAGATFEGSSISWAPILTVKHPSFATYGKSGGFNQNEPDF